jgi:CRISPR system Cascade subunit CasE
MTAQLFLTRAKISRQASAKALARLLVPSHTDQRVAASHNLLWTLFGDEPDRARDFLWREDGEGAFFILSARLPIDRHELFEFDEPKLFHPSLQVGERFRFLLRANATVTVKVASGEPGAEIKKRRGKRHDVVMHALSALPKDVKRAEARFDVEQQASLSWLQGQGERSGFAVEQLSCLAYETLRIPHGKNPIRIGVVDLEGTLTVSNPELFLGQLANGFGRAKAYGCGLMMLRRAA